MSDKQASNHTSSEADQDEEALQDDLFAALDEAEDEPEVQPQPSADAQTEEVPALLPSLEVRAPYALPVAPQLEFTPRPYQQSAVDAWLRNGGRGVVVLPTGAGKTVVAYDAIARMAVRTLVIVPTIELLRQWRSGMIERLRLPKSLVGAVGGGEHTTGPLTVITYDSAAMKRRKLDGYGLLVFDEVHHLPAQSYRAIVEKRERALAAGTERHAGALRRTPRRPERVDRASRLRARR